MLSIHVPLVKKQSSKDRPVHVDPRRIVRFNLEDGRIELLTGGLIIGSCKERY